MSPKIFLSFFSKFRLSYQDALEEQEYSQIKIPLLKNFFTYLLVCLMLLFIPLTVRFFYLHHHTLGYMSLGMLFLAGLLYLSRNVFGRWMEYVVVGYLLAVVLLVIFNLAQVLLSLKSCESFYGGYAFALLHRILGYRVVKVHSMFFFHVVSLTFRLVFLYDHDLSVSLTVSAVEVVTVYLSVKSEIGERDLFDSLYKSKKQLEKFKDFLTEHLPNQMAIFSRDCSSAHFMNNSFAQSFECEDVSKVKPTLETLVVELDTIDKNCDLFGQTDFTSFSVESPLTLCNLLSLLSKSPNLTKDLEMCSFQVYEEVPLAKKMTLSDLQKVEKLSPLLPTMSVNVSKLQESQSLLASSVHQKNLNHSAEDESEKSQSKDSKKRTRRVFKVKVVPSLWDGKEAIAIILDDITQQRTIMELKMAAKNKDLVIAMVSHELRTPLTGMLGLIDITKKLVVNDQEAMSHLTACKNSGVFLLSLVNSILDLSQIRNNKLRLNYTEVSVSDLLIELKSLFEPFYAQKNLYLNIDIQENVPKILVTDRSRLMQILINLVGNAFKFTFEGGITIKVEATSAHRVHFSIQDTGLGIKEEDQEKLFKVFGKLEQRDKNVNAHGVGLGLTISNTLAALLNPSEKQGVRLNSKIGQGSTFWFVVESQEQDLPKAQSFENFIDEIQPDIDELALETKVTRYETASILNFGKIKSNWDSSFQLSAKFNRKRAPKDSSYMLLSGTSTPASRCRSQSSHNSSNGKIDGRSATYAGKCEDKPWCLIVDDNPFNIIVATHLMEEKGYRIKKALNGEEAIQEMMKHHSSGENFKVVLMDCQMPVMDGFEATRIIRKKMKEGELSECAIIALTANNRDADHEKLCDEVGFDGTVSKPMNIAEVNSILQKVQKSMK